MTSKEKSKEDRLKDKYDDSDMKNNMKDQYGKEEGEKVYYATIRKQAMKKESFEINPEEHRKAKKIAKIRNLAKNNKNPAEKEAAEKKAGGPKLVGEGILDRLKPKKKENKKPEIPTGAEKKIRDWRKKRKQAEHEKYVNFLPVDENKTWDQFKKHI